MTARSLHRWQEEIGLRATLDARDEAHIIPAERRRLIAVRVDTARRLAGRRAA